MDNSSNDVVVDSANTDNTTSDNISYTGSSLYMNRAATILTTNQYVYEGDVVDDTTISNANQTVFGGQVTSTTIINGSQTVSSGTVIDTTFISSGGYQAVSGGVVTSTSFVNGSQVVYSSGSANGNFFDGTGYPVVSTYDGVVTNTVIASGYQRILGSAINTSIGSGMQVVGSLAYVSNTTIDDGEQDIWGGDVVDTKIINGYQRDWGGGGIVSNTSIYSGSQILSAGTVYDTTIISGAQIVLGGAISGTTYLHQNAS